MILNNGEKAYNRVKEERCGFMKIKFDNITAKTAKYCALIFTVLLLIGLVFSFLEIPGTEVFYCAFRFKAVFCPSAGLRLRNPG